MCPVSEVPRAHGFAVLAFCTSALAHYAMALRFCSQHRYRHCQALLCMAISSFAAIFALVLISRFDETLIPNHVPYLFYIFEAFGLSSMAVFPMFWYMEQHDDPGQRSLRGPPGSHELSNSLQGSGERPSLQVG
mmetsp:Transcript_72516/g.224152  ORF Transcript_72516/g.224152 Transcript_72516/m.224152 type:complete len:134 (+) Transcript_72516:387-788(+)